MTTRLTIGAAVLVEGVVVHKRLRPCPHSLRYRVFSLLIDLDRIDEAAAQCRWFRHNRTGLLSLYDRDHLAQPSRGLAIEARALFANAGFDMDAARVLLLAYPRLFGFAFNPISVFYLVGADDGIRAIIYEVRNTFGECKCYVTAAGAALSGIHAHGFDKELFVSPFAPGQGRYSFRLGLDEAAIVVGVAFRDGDGPLIKTHFVGVPGPLTTMRVAAAVARLPFMTLKVAVGIHWEALKLWLKGVPLTRRHRSPRFSVSVANTPALTLKNDHVRS